MNEECGCCGDGCVPEEKKVEETTETQIESPVEEEKKEENPTEEPTNEEKPAEETTSTEEETAEKTVEEGSEKTIKPAEDMIRDIINLINVKKTEEKIDSETAGELLAKLEELAVKAGDYCDH